MTEIILTFTPKGEVTVEVIGCDGPECVEKTRDLEAAIGRPLKRALKSDFKKKAAGRNVRVK